MDVFKQECKLCDDIIRYGNFKVIGEFEKNIFGILLLKLTLDDDTQNVICTMCWSKLLAALNFKSTCLYTDNSIIPYVDFEKPKLVALKEIYSKEKGSKQRSRILDDWEICRLCSQPMGNYHKSIQEVPVDSIEIYIPEINFAVSTNPMICIKCRDALCVHSTFIRNCLDIEQKRHLNARNAGDMVFTNPCIKIEEIEIKCENEEGDTSLRSQSDLIDVEETKILYDFEDMKQSSAESTVVSYKTKECTSKTPCDGNRKRKRQYGHKNQVKFKRTDLKVQKYQCDKCIFKTRHRKSYTRHQLLHKDPLEVQMFGCDECDYKSIHKQSVRTHQLRHKDPSELQMFECDKCDYKSIYKGHLKQHQVGHKDPSEVQMFQCGECDFGTNRKQNLRIHQLKWHKDPSEAQIFQCDECDYTNKNKGRLKYHQLIHKDVSELQMFQCYQCNFISLYKKSIQDHQLIHKNPSEVQMFQCDECDYKSVRKGDIKKHQLRHKDPSELRIFECDECDYKCIRKRNLIDHQRRKHRPL